tara:strand:+ start:2727 stop:3368 length:642 start_codon:yes stop_codon:yes gene_type:complete
MSKELIMRIISSLILLPLSFYFIIKGNVLFTLFTLIILLITLYEWHLLSYKKKYYLPGIIFIFFSIYTFYYFRNEGEYNIFLLIIIVCIGTDIGGYAFGKFLKGPKLTKISPNKTYSGMFGSFILSIVFAYIYFKNLSFFSFLAVDKIEQQTIYIVIFISILSQIGDIIISLFKRKSKLKNTGVIIPGHGGLLDRIDGMIFAFPFIFILFKII